MSKEKICGIYCIRNSINGVKYIGQSTDIYNRWKDHRWALNNDVHHNTYIQNAWNKYGEENFDFLIVEECDESQLNENEIFWVAVFDTFNNGYNLTAGGDGCNGKQWTDDERASISRAVLQIDLLGNIVNEWINIGEAAVCTGINDRQIWNVAKKQMGVDRYGKPRRTAKTAGGYIWCYKDEYDSFQLEDYVDKRKITPVRQYDFNWNLVKTWQSSESTKTGGYCPTVVLNACKGVWKEAYGYIWTFDNIDNLDEYIEWYKDHFCIDYIVQFSKNNTPLNVWSMIKDVENDGFSQACVSNVLRGVASTHKGFDFKRISWRELEKLNWKGQIKYGKHKEERSKIDF